MGADESRTIELELVEVEVIEAVAAVVDERMRIELAFEVKLLVVVVVVDERRTIALDETAVEAVVERMRSQHGLVVVAVVQKMTIELALVLIEAVVVVVGKIVAEVNALAFALVAVKVQKIVAAASWDKMVLANIVIASLALALALACSLLSTEIVRIVAVFCNFFRPFFFF